MVKKLLLKTAFKGAKDKLYFCGTSSDGFITVNEADMKRKKKAVKAKK